MVTIEDVDMLERQGYEEVLLDLLDGQRQFDNIIYVATTNYIDRLSDRITNRPSRFDIVKLIDVPDVKARYDFLVNIMVSAGEVVPDKELEELAQYTEGYSYAHIKELVILIYVMGLDRSESLDRVGSLVKQGTEIPEDVTNHKVSEFDPDYYGYGDEVAEYDPPYINQTICK
jgi:SpoVK/Ycf46/Vps4 family AAA+-type ATPase